MTVVNDSETEEIKKCIQKDDLDTRLRALKPINKKRGDKLRKAFDFLNNELKDLGVIDYKQAKEEYFNEKYGL